MDNSRVERLIALIEAENWPVSGLLSLRDLADPDELRQSLIEGFRSGRLSAEVVSQVLGLHATEVPAWFSEPRWKQLDDLDSRSDPAEGWV